MYLTRLSLTNFRSLSRLDLDFPRRIILLLGNNAQGKTSILEAIYYLATFSSFHATHDRQLINFGLADDPLVVTRIVADYLANNKKHTFEVRLIQEANASYALPRFRKEILLDGVKKKVGEAVGFFNAVIFTPQMSRIVEGAPSDRRRYLDDLISQVVPHYGQHLTRYAKVLTQRNALLKQLAERGGDASQLEVWDEMLAKHGSEIIIARIHAIKDMETYAKRLHYRLTDEKEVLRLAYIPAYEPLKLPKGQLALPVEYEIDRSNIDLIEIYEGFLRELNTSHKKDITRRATSIGPHRDELRFISNRIDLGDYGSRGQDRTTLLSMKLAEVEWMHTKTGEWPVLLLDEIMAELDPKRRVDLLTELNSAEQGILTSTDLEMFEAGFIQDHQVWRVDAGIVSR